MWEGVLQEVTAMGWQELGLENENEEEEMTRGSKVTVLSFGE